MSVSYEWLSESKLLRLHPSELRKIKAGINDKQFRKKLLGLFGSYLSKLTDPDESDLYDVMAITLQLHSVDLWRHESPETFIAGITEMNTSIQKKFYDTLDLPLPELKKSTPTKPNKMMGYAALTHLPELEESPQTSPPTSNIGDKINVIAELIYGLDSKHYQQIVAEIAKERPRQFPRAAEKANEIIGPTLNENKNKKAS